jgi:voltage-gated potassium channel
LIETILNFIRNISPKWISILVIALGISNIISSIIALPSRGLVLEILTRGIVQASGFSELVVGWVLTIIGYGLFLKYKLAWQAAIVLLTISIILNSFQINFFGIGFSAIMLLLIYVSGRNYRKHLAHVLDVQYITIFWAIVFATLYGVVGSLLYGEYFLPPIDNYIKAFYFTVTTITTVGYGDIVPNTDEARLFTTTLIVIGVAIFLAATLLIGQSFMNRMTKESENLKAKEKINHDN